MISFLIDIFNIFYLTVTDLISPKKLINIKRCDNDFTFLFEIFNKAELYVLEMILNYSFFLRFWI
jgi:hypothetical protein